MTAKPVPLPSSTLLSLPLPDTPGKTSANMQTDLVFWVHYNKYHKWRLQGSGA